MPEKIKNDKNKKNNTQKKGNAGKIVSIAASVIILAAAGFAVVKLGSTSFSKKKPGTGNTAVVHHNNDSYPDGYADIVMIADNASAEELYAAAELVEMRLNNREFSEISVKPDADNMKIKAHYKWSLQDGDFDPEKTAIEITAKNDISFRCGTDIDPNTFELSAEIAASGEDIESAEIEKIGENGVPVYKIKFTFNEKGKASLLSATQQLCGTNTPLTFWMDNSMLYSEMIEEPISDGVFTVRTKCATYIEAEKFLCRVNDGLLKTDLTLDDFQQTTK